LVHDLRLVEANSVSQDLDSRISAVAIGWHAKLCADVVSANGGIVSGEDRVGEVSTLLGHVKDEIRSLEICLRDREVENSLSGRQVDWDSGIDTSLCRSSNGEDCQRRNCRKMHGERFNETTTTWTQTLGDEAFSAFMELHHPP